MWDCVITCATISIYIDMGIGKGGLFYAHPKVERRETHSSGKREMRSIDKGCQFGYEMQKIKSFILLQNRMGASGKGVSAPLCSISSSTWGTGSYCYMDGKQ